MYRVDNVPKRYEMSEKKWRGDTIWCLRDCSKSGHDPNLGIAKCLEESAKERQETVMRVSRSNLLLAFPLLILDTSLIDFDALYSLDLFFWRQKVRGCRGVREEEPKHWCQTKMRFAPTEV